MPPTTTPPRHPLLATQEELQCMDAALEAFTQEWEDSDDLDFIQAVQTARCLMNRIQRILSVTQHKESSDVG